MKMNGRSFHHCHGQPWNLQSCREEEPKADKVKHSPPWVARVLYGVFLFVLLAKPCRQPAVHPELLEICVRETLRAELSAGSTGGEQMLCKDSDSPVNAKDTTPWILSVCLFLQSVWAWGPWKGGELGRASFSDLLSGNRL
jgi:hypothetical protein